MNSKITVWCDCGECAMCRPDLHKKENECVKCGCYNLTEFKKVEHKHIHCLDCYRQVRNAKQREYREKKREQYTCECCGEYDKKSVGLATGENGVEMRVCRFCDVDGSNYNGWGDKEEELLETKCGCHIIINSREHDECRCDDDGENWICGDCYNGEYDEEDKCSECGLDEDDCECDVCYGKHCDKKSCLKLATGWNRLWGGVAEKRFEENLYCDDCIEQDCFEKCEACRVVYPMTSLNYRTGGLFGEHCGNNLYCGACCKDIERRM